MLVRQLSPYDRNLLKSKKLCGFLESTPCGLFCNSSHHPLAVRGLRSMVLSSTAHNECSGACDAEARFHKCELICGGNCWRKPADVDPGNARLLFLQSQNQASLNTIVQCAERERLLLIEEDVAMLRHRTQHLLTIYTNRLSRLFCRTHLSNITIRFS